MGRKDKPISLQGDNAHSVGMRLRAARKSTGKSLTEMAKALTYSVGYLSGVENGKHEVPVELIRRYEEELGLKLGELNEFVQAHRKIEPARKQRPWYVPLLRNHLFTGRETILEDMHKRLWNSGGIPPVLSIVGISGMGKTQLALEYAYRYGDKYQGVFWLDASSSETLVASCLELARYLEVPEKDAQDRRATIIGVQRRLREITGSLVILDNVEDPALLYNIEFSTSLNEFLSQLGESNIIVTTRMRMIGPIMQMIDLGEMGINESVLLLLRRAKFISVNASLSEVPETSLDLAREISRTMGGLPIALDQAGSYLEETGCGLLGYLHLLETRRKKEPGYQSFSAYTAHVAEIWLLSVEKVQETNPDAVELLYLCAFLGSGKIYEEFLIEAGTFAGPTLQALITDAFKLHQAIGILRKYSLVRTDAESGALFMHPLVQAVVQNSLDLAARQEWATRVVKIVSQVFPAIKMETTYRNIWRKCQLYFPQAEACVELIKEEGMQGEDVTQLLRKIGKYLEERTQLKDAEEIYQRALGLDRQCYGEVHIAVAADLSHLAILYEKQNYERLAEECYEQAIFIQEQMGKLESLDPVVLRGYLRLLWKTKQASKVGKLRQHMDMPHREQGKRAVKRIPINDDDEKITYQEDADWSYEQRRGIGNFNDDAHITSTKGTSFEFSFEGIGIEIISNTISAHGELEIYIDTMFVDTVNISRISSKLTQTIIFSKTDLELGPHTLKVVVTNGTFVLDALAVFSYEEDEPGNERVQ